MKYLTTAALLTALLTTCSSLAASTDSTATLVSAYLVAKGGSHTLEVGSTLQFLAYGIYSDGAIYELPDSRGSSITAWNTSNHAVARISSAGHVTPAAPGSIQIEGAAGSIIATPWSLAVTTLPPVPPPTISCSGQPGLIGQGGTAKITSVSTSAKGLAVSYRDTASSGSISGSGANETLLTSPSVAGTVTVTCAIEQSGGGKASATTQVVVAAESADLNASRSWTAVHDSGTPGESRGSTVYPKNVAPYDHARLFYMTYEGQAGERFSLSFGQSAPATHFVYAASVYLVDPPQVANIEMDINQVMANGETVIFGTQCSSYSGRWEYTINKTTKGRTHPGWTASNIPCNPTQWKARSWHAIEICSSRNAAGRVTYEWVSFDGVVYPFKAAEGASAQRWVGIRVR